MEVLDASGLTIGSNVLGRAPLLLDEMLAPETLSTSIVTGPLLVGDVSVHKRKQ